MTDNTKIYSHSAQQYWHLWLFAIIWNAMTWFAIVKGGHNILRAFEENPVFYFFVLFPFIGLWCIYLAIVQTLAWYKFGKTPVVLNPHPGQIGGQCSGYITLPIIEKQASRATLSLSCIRSSIHRSSDGKSSRHEKAIWQDRITLKPDKYGRKNTRINFTFSPPAHLPATEELSDDYHLWRLQVRIPLPGIDYDRLFELPMEQADEQVLASYSHMQSTDSEVVEHRDTQVGEIPQIKQTSTGTQFYYGYGREKTMALIVLFFGLGLGAFGYFFFDGFLDFLPATSGLMVAYVGLISLALILLGLFMIANSLTISVSLMGINKQQRIFGFLLEEKTDAVDIVDITTKQTGSMTSGNTTRVWYSLKLHTRNGRDIEVGDHLEGQSYADEVRQQMMTALGHTWQAGTQDKTEKKPKTPIPGWLRWVGKSLSYSFIIAMIYDLNKMFPEAYELISQFFS